MRTHAREREREKERERERKREREDSNQRQIRSIKGSREVSRESETSEQRKIKEVQTVQENFVQAESTDQKMLTIHACLLKTLDNLGKEKLDRFKWYLKKNHDSISVADIENANAFKTVDIMEAQFTERAVEVTLDILRIMNENHLAEQLEDSSRRLEADLR
ncbi:hypothetical protein G5714_000097 [Onychostoma macrolepis]|uniref:Pyrin domain-containing protein n=1 Tax=Onychostoma macrolepis TaxID=369639 RepID=A0A7J6DFD6_9TELE|nr:hypothetical protein G5714_000097 [Onychostoma macrolepis]